MTLVEFSDQFDLHYNNITSNQAPGLSEYEKSVFLTKAQDEIVKNYFTANSKGNNIGQGFDDSAKRQADFSVLMKTFKGTKATSSADFDGERVDDRSFIFTFPTDVFIPVNEVLTVTENNAVKKRFQVIPLKFDEYTKLMSKPFQRPLKNQAWRLINSGTVGTDNNNQLVYRKSVEIITSPNYTSNTNLNYVIRYVRRPEPIILGNLDGLTIGGKGFSNKECELDPILHEDILQRAVELAKVAWTVTGQDNTQMVMTAGQRSE